FEGPDVNFLEDPAVNAELAIEKLFPLLVAGERNAARQEVRNLLDAEWSPEDIAQEVFWPIHENIARLYRADQLSELAEHYATRMLRMLVDQMQVMYTQRDLNDRSVLIFCGLTEGDELAAQLVADLAEADGYKVRFAGGGIANDEILEEMNAYKPDVLLLFSSSATDAPNIRQLIDTVREIGSAPDVQFAVGGGIFNRAEGLAQEIGADVWATSPLEMLDLLRDAKDRRATPEQRTVGRTRRQTRSAAA
ncbi:MAG: cobalamin-dependent protein, partial [Planctomycetota bacterium]